MGVVVVSMASRILKILQPPFLGWADPGWTVKSWNLVYCRQRVNNTTINRTCHLPVTTATTNTNNTISITTILAWTRTTRTPFMRILA